MTKGTKRIIGRQQINNLYHPRPGSMRRTNTIGRIFKGKTVTRVFAKLSRCLEVYIGRRFACCHLIAANDDIEKRMKACPLHQHFRLGGAG